jgi:nucleoside-diphosphate-sugar epimerase
LGASNLSVEEGDEILCYGRNRVYRRASEALATQADYTFYATADKARRDLGWQPRPLEATFKEVLDGKLARRKK